MSSRDWILAGAVVALLSGLGGVFLFVRHLGYQDGFADAQGACHAQQRQMEDANRRAISEAERALMRAADHLSLEQLESDNALAGIDQAAAADPRGGAACLGAGSVQRLNAIR